MSINFFLLVCCLVPTLKNSEKETFFFVFFQVYKKRVFQPHINLFWSSIMRVCDTRFVKRSEGSMQPPFDLREFIIHRCNNRKQFKDIKIVHRRNLAYSGFADSRWRSIFIQSTSEEDEELPIPVARLEARENYDKKTHEIRETCVFHSAGWMSKEKIKFVYSPPNLQSLAWASVLNYGAFNPTERNLYLLKRISETGDATVNVHFLWHRTRPCRMKPWTPAELFNAKPNLEPFSHFSPSIKRSLYYGGEKVKIEI